MDNILWTILKITQRTGKEKAFHKKDDICKSQLSDHEELHNVFKGFSSHYLHMNSYDFIKAEDNV